MVEGISKLNARRKTVLIECFSLMQGSAKNFIAFIDCAELSWEGGHDYFY